MNRQRGKAGAHLSAEGAQLVGAAGGNVAEHAARYPPQQVLKVGCRVLRAQARLLLHSCVGLPLGGGTLHDPASRH